MQNRYVGDVGDFANNGLLRWLTGMTRPVVGQAHRLRLGVVSYLNHDDGPYGNLINYHILQECDQALFNTLQNLVNAGNRNVEACEYTQLMPPGTLFFNGCRCSYSNRQDWLDDAVANTAVSNPHLVFLNPDNGIREEPYEGLNDSPKHAYLGDIETFLHNGRSLVIYHHLRRENHAGQIADIGGLLINLFPGVQIRAFRFGAIPPFGGNDPIPARAYFIVIQEDHRDQITDRLESFVNESPLYAPPNYLFVEFPVA